MKKLKRSECSLGWTDHAYRRLQQRIKAGIPFGFSRRKLRRERKGISPFNEIVFHKQVKGLPF